MTAAGMHSSESWNTTNAKICEVLPDIFEDTSGMLSSEVSRFYLGKFPAAKK